MKVRKQSPLDADHMRMLHREAVEQLELLRSVFDAIVHAIGVYRDNLYQIALSHWHAYLDVMHMLCMHDEKFNAAMQRFGLHEEKKAENENTTEMQRALITQLISALTRRHRRFDYYLIARGTPMTEYLQESIALEREHIAELIAMLDNVL